MTDKGRDVKKGAICMAMMAVGVVTEPAFADQNIDELRAELAAQRTRLEWLEKKLETATGQAETAKAAADSAVAKVGAGASGGAGASAAAGGVKIYGIADAGLEIGDYGRGTRVRVQSGLGNSSRLGFKGERSFGDDLAGYFQLEAGVSFDNGQNTGHSSNISNPGQGAPSSSAPNTTGVAIFSRNTFVGLRGRFGDVRFGRDYVPTYLITRAVDPFRIGGATAFRLVASAAASRFDNGVFYSSPSFAGVSAKLAYSAGMENNSTSNVGITGANTSTGPENEGKGWSGGLDYKQGGLFLAAGYLSFLRTGSVAAPATENVRRTSKNLAASYDFKSFKLYGQFLNGEDTQAGAATNKSLDRNVWWVGVSVPMARHTVRAVYSRLDDRLATNRDSDHVGVGYEYALDNQTDLYAFYARVTNQNGGQNSLCAGGTCQGFDKDTNLPPNFTPKSLMLGVRYRF